jgi:cation-dependent mannose-6-phosphate receptor
VHDGAAFKFSDYSDEDEDAAAFFRDDDDQKHPSKDDDKDTSRRKSTTISFLCDRDPTSSSAGVSFVGTDPDECAYFFEVRSQHACASAEPHQPGSVGPGGVFALIFAIALLVYIFGGIFYNRTVAHARGWRQLPNYSLWAGIWGFITVSTVSIPSLLRSQIR